tara:strand:+ start:71 stop:2254 length:2184 start_codon:yes stop_codon:yes gene_type:complete
MAYKFQVGVAQLSGNLTQEGALTAEGLASLDGGIDVNGSNFTVSTAGALSAAGLANLDGGIEVDNGGNKFTVSTAGAVVAEGSVSGAAGTFDTLAGTSLALQSGGITAAGAIAGATTIAASGLANLDGGIEVDNGGNKFTVSTAGAVVAESSISGAAGTFDALAGTSLALQSGGITAAGAIAGATTITATGLVSSSAALNGLSLDINSAASVSSAGAASFASANLNAGGITNAGSIVGATTISGSSTISGLELDIEKSANIAQAADIGGKLTVVGVSDLDGGIDVNGGNFAVNASGEITASPSGSITDLYVGDDAQIAGTATIEGALRADSAATFASTVAVNGLSNLDGGIEIDNSGNKFTVSTAGAVMAAALANLDGGIEVDNGGNKFTVSTAGAVMAVGAISSSAALEGLSLDINSAASVSSAGAASFASANLNSGGITNAGAIVGAAAVSGSGVFSMSAIDNDGVLNNAGAANIVGKLTVTAVSDLDGGIDVNGGNFAVSTAGNITACPSGSITDLLVGDDLQVVGDSRFDGDVALISSTTASFGLHIMNSVGLVVGSTGQFQVDPSNGDISTSGDVTGSAFNFGKGADFKIAQSLLPDRTGALDLGSSALPYRAVYADTFIGNIAFDTQTVTDFGPVESASDIVYVNMASTGLTLELPTGSAGKVLRIKMSGERPFQISGAAGTGDTVFDQPADSILVMMEALGAAMTCVYSGSAGSGKWHII